MQIGKLRNSSIRCGAFFLGCWLALAGLLMAAAILPAQIKIEAHEPAILRDGAGVQRITIKNDGTAAVPLGFTVGTFYDDTACTKIEAPKITFSLDSGGSLPTTLAPKQSIEAIADFHGFAGSLAAHAALFNQGANVAKLHLVAIDTPLNISLDGEGTADNPIAYRLNHSTSTTDTSTNLANTVPAVTTDSCTTLATTTNSSHAATSTATTFITLKNSGKDYVTLDWTLAVRGISQGSGTAVMAPGGLYRLPLSPTPAVYDLVDFLMPRKLTGLLLLRPHTPAGVDTVLFNLQPLPVSLTMDRGSSTKTQVFLVIFVVLLLLFGGGLSLLSNSILPNFQTKLAYEKRVGSLADRTSTISTRVNSYLRVLLRLDRKKIARALDDVHFYSISTEKLDAAAAGMDKLEKRLIVVETLDRLWRRFEIVSASAPPSVSDLIAQTLESAAGQLHSVDLGDDDVAAANIFLTKARLDMDSLADLDLQTKRVADKFKQIKSRLKVFPHGYYQDLRDALPGIFNIFKEHFDSADELVPTMLFAVDHGITAGHIALDYAMVRATIAHSVPGGCGTAGAVALDRLKQRECLLLELLGTLSWKALRGANLLVQQMREDIYMSDVLDEIKKHEDQKDRIVRIAYDTMRVRPYLPVFFSLAFDNPRFANAAALRCVIYRWTFPQELFEDAATVCHYFTGEEPGILSKAGDRASDASPKQLREQLGFSIPISLEIHCPDHPGDCARLTETVHVDRNAEQASSYVELVRFGLALVVAVVVLAAGIMDQIKKLDLLPAIVAVVALGYSADSIKNILGQAPKTTPAPPAQK